MFLLVPPKNILKLCDRRSSVPFNFAVSTKQIIFKRPFYPQCFLKCYYFESAGLVTQRTSFIKCRYLHLAHALLHTPVPTIALVLGNLSEVAADLDRLLCQATSELQSEGTNSLLVVNGTADKQIYDSCLPFHRFLQTLMFRITVLLHTLHFHRTTLYT
jgi:hypothetical protein